MPAFHLVDVVTGAGVSNAFFAGARGALVVFLCRHCPYVVHIREELGLLVRGISDEGIRTVAICANDPVRYPDDSPDRLREMAVELGWEFPVLFDESQDVARAFGAVCTPDLFLYDAAGGLYYHGRFDDSTPGNGKPVTGAEIRGAIRALLSGSPAPPAAHPSIGCGIKWR